MARLKLSSDDAFDDIALSGVTHHQGALETLVEATEEEVQFPLADIAVDSGTQIRETEDKDAIERYTALYLAQVKLKPLWLRRLADGRVVIGDGFHRYRSGLAAGLEALPAIVRPGTLVDAYLDGLRGNREHGLALSTGDRAKAARLILLGQKDREKPMSDGVIATEVGLSRQRIGQIAQELTRKGLLVRDTVRAGHDGRSINTGRIAAAQTARALDQLSAELKKIDQDEIQNEQDRAGPTSERADHDRGEDAGVDVADASASAAVPTPKGDQQEKTQPGQSETGAGFASEKAIQQALKALGPWERKTQELGLNVHDQIRVLWKRIRQFRAKLDSGK